MSFDLALFRTRDVTIVLFAGDHQVLVHTLELKFTQDRPLSPLQNASCFNASRFGINTGEAHFNGTSSAKLPFFQKAAAVVVIVDFICGME